MSKNPEYGICMFFKGNHYCIPFGRYDDLKNGEIYISIGDKEKGGHISLHKSGVKHYRENDGYTIPLTDEDLLQYLMEDLNQLMNMNVPERKLVIKMKKSIDAIRRFGGCFDPNCKNRKGAVIDFDVLRTKFVDFLNEHRKSIHQIWGETINKVEDEEEDNKENDKLSQIINKMNIEKIPECKYCNDKYRIIYNKKKKEYYWKKCPRCSGLGFDLVYLEQFRVDND